MVGFFFSSQHVAPHLLFPPNTPNRHDQLLKRNLTSILRSNSSDSNPEDFFIILRYEFRRRRKLYGVRITHILARAPCIIRVSIFKLAALLICQPLYGFFLNLIFLAVVVGRRRLGGKWTCATYLPSYQNYFFV